MGTPGDSETRAARHSLYLTFDVLWQSGRLSRTEAYAWLARVMNKTKDECHIGMFTQDECSTVEEIIVQTFGDEMNE